MDELSLFTGAGGGLLGTYLLGFRPIGYVEWDDYCQRVLSQRIKDGILHNAPIFSDVRAFVNDGYAASYTGLVDILTAGFPCQPFSIAGKQRGADDERNMWPTTADVIRIVRPRFVLLENVPGIRPYLPVVIRDLRRLGYTVRRPLQLGADDTGAPHRRKRVWIVAYSFGTGTGDNPGTIGADRGRGIWRDESALRQAHGPHGTDRFEPTSSLTANVADAEGNTERPGLCPDESGRIRWGRSSDGSSTGTAVADSTGGSEQQSGTRSDERRFQGEVLREGGNPGNWPVEPGICRVVDGMAYRVDRLRALGNGQVPRVVATAWRLLTHG